MNCPVCFGSATVLLTSTVCQTPSCRNFKPDDNTTSWDLEVAALKDGHQICAGCDRTRAQCDADEWGCDNCDCPDPIFLGIPQIFLDL